MSALRTAFCILLGSTTVAVTASAGEATTARCVTAAERGQKERDEGRLVESRATFVSCGEEACPAVVRRECLHWLEEVDRRLPTIVVSVVDEGGKDVVDATVTLDGRPLTTLGRETSVDPGQHRITATRAHGSTAEEMVVVREGEKGRAVTLTSAGSISDRGTRHADTTPTTPAKEASPRVPTLTWILAGVAAAGAGGFAYLWSRGVNDVHDLRATCAPACSGRAVDDAATFLNTGRLSLGIGIAAAVGAVVVYVFRPTEARSAARSGRSGSGLELRF